MHVTRNAGDRLSTIFACVSLGGLVFSSAVAYVGLTTKVDSKSTRLALRSVGCFGLAISTSIVVMEGIIICENIKSACRSKDEK